MKTKSRSNFKNQGFTLLEVVITLIVGSILGAILVQFMGTSMKNSFEPVIMVQNGYGGHEIMEKLNSVYKMRLMTSTGDPLDDFRTDVINGRLPLIAPVIGHYTAAMNYIVFDNNGDEVSDNIQLRILKVTITHGGQSLTALFTR